MNRVTLRFDLPSDSRFSIDDGQKLCCLVLNLFEEFEIPSSDVSSDVLVEFKHRVINGFNTEKVMK